MDWHWIATHLWTFTGKILNDSQLKHRSTLVGYEEFTGLEYRRALFAENIGGSTQLANLERGHFIGFPNCANLAELEAHLKQWVMLKGKYGADLPEDHLIGMLWNIIPAKMKEEIQKQRHLTGKLNEQIACATPRSTRGPTSNSPSGTSRNCSINSGTIIRTPLGSVPLLLNPLDMLMLKLHFAGHVLLSTTWRPLRPRWSALARI